ncbi:methionine synthase [Methanothermobacter sp.]|uniref:methionine synthase n=1 Tax=Methanothermobacter sp. TaxID=1884223 RepID=UPI002602C231|nr:methionine synthase [Methanothermobacter sp.]MDI9614187.1 methionine synthase [Methanothermobacter sp.]
MKLQSTDGDIVITTVVGSYPATPRGPETLRERISSFLGSYDACRPAIETAVRDQVMAGIDIISDGQVRGDMVGHFAEAMGGMRVKDGVSIIFSRITPPSGSIGSHDLRYAMGILRKLTDDESKGVKGIITGPSTMVHASRIEGFYSPQKRERAIMDMAEALRVEAEHLQDAGAVMIQIDEPFLSTGMVDMGTARRAVKRISGALDVDVSLHVCGDISGVIGELLTFPVDMLDLEFAGRPSNLEVLAEKWRGDKKLGFGCVDTSTEVVESTDTIKNLIERGADIAGEDNLYIDPDCGMRKLPREAAFAKLRNMVKAASEF